MRAAAEVAPGLWVAPDPWDWTEADFRPWPAILFCAKDPYHRQAVGYMGNLPRDHVEYRFAWRPGDGNRVRLYLNLVDATVARYIDDKVVEAGLHFLNVTEGLDRLVVCNQGCSRSACMALMWLRTQGMAADELAVAEVDFKQRYPPYDPSPGIHEWMRAHWEELLDRFPGGTSITRARQ